ncbi:DUF6402 family protein [Variovorax sp. RHLX14]|uniref:DUF6402 family protein n=1 Tax=Variovorax sp. RHLX14 TaxID=1259731 RepID=UPI003F4760E5
MSNETVTELGRYEFGKNGRVVLSRSARPITYYTRSWWTYTWVACVVSDKEGCAVVAQAALSLDQAPPPLRSPPIPASAAATLISAANPPAKTPLTQAESDALRLMKALRVAESVRTWWNKPFPPLLPPKPAALSAPLPAPAIQKSSAAPIIPPFDIQQIPDAMEKLKLPVSARMMRYWFAGSENYSKTGEDLVAGIDQYGNPYASDMIDKNIITLDWVLTFQRAQKAYDDLLSDAVYKPTARVEIKKRLSAFIRRQSGTFASIDGMTSSGLDIHRLHSDFQFQKISIDAKLSEKFFLWIDGRAGAIKAPDDLTGALGAFSIYAALGEVSFSSVSRVARVKSIYLYVRDSYSFLDKDQEQSQYLGHWNEDGVYLAPLPSIYRKGLGSWIGAPLADIKRSIYEKSAIMYPVSNRSFRDWRAKHNRGGDFLSYTDARKVRLPQELLVSL